MQKDKAKYASAAHQRADELLGRIREAAQELLVEQGRANAALESMAATWGERLKPLQERITTLDKDLKALEKAERQAFFGVSESCRVELPQGALLFQVSRHVKKAKGVLAELERQGLEEGLKRVVTVDWDALEAWPNEKLIMVGTERVKKEIYSYEVKG